VLQGRPIVNRWPNTARSSMTPRAEIEQAFADYQRHGVRGLAVAADDPTTAPNAIASPPRDGRSKKVSSSAS